MLAAARNAYHGSPATITVTSATNVKELNDGKLLLIAYVNKLAVKAPEIAAMNAEMQNTRTLVTLTVRPYVSSATGESPIARRSFPSRVCVRTAISTAINATATTIT